ncbi:hypothetical protein ACJX0J_011899, partial [Zea mays]
KTVLYAYWKFFYKKPAYIHMVYDHTSMDVILLATSRASRSVEQRITYTISYEHNNEFLFTSTKVIDNCVQQKLHAEVQSLFKYKSSSGFTAGGLEDKEMRMNGVGYGLRNLLYLAPDFYIYCKLKIVRGRQTDANHTPFMLIAVDLNHHIFVSDLLA